MQRLEPIQVPKFDGGVNLSTTEDNLADNELVEGLNMNLNIDGSLYTRQGCDQYGSTLTGAGRITSIYYARTTTGANEARIVTTKQKVYKDNGAGGWTDITGATTPPDDTLWMWRMFNNVAIGVNGSSVPQKYAFGAALADLTGSPPDKCKLIEVFRGRVYLAGDTDEPTALHACAAGNASDWTTSLDAFLIYVDKDNGHPITGIVKFFDNLVIFKRKGVYLLTPADNIPGNMQLSQIFDDIGCVSPYSIKQIGNEVVWADDDGVYALKATQQFGDVAYAAVSKKVQPWIDDQAPTKINECYGHDCRGVNQYRLSWPKASATTNNHVLVRDYYHQAWLHHEGIAFACYGRWEVGSYVYQMAGGYDGKVYRVDTTENDDGAAFVKKVKTKRYTWGSPVVRKLFHRAFLEFQLGGAYALGYTADIDYGRVVKGASLTDPSVANLWDVGKWDEAKWGGQSVARSFVNVSLKGRNIQHQFLNQNADEPFTIFKIACGASALGWRGP